MSTKSPLIFLATGGTGGHVFPAEALATALANRGCRLALITDKRGGNFSGRLGEIETIRISAGAVAGRGIIGKAISALELGWGTLQARALLKKRLPDCVIGFGGYASVPTMLAATFLGLSTAVHEQNALLGRANSLLATRVNRVATAFESLRGFPETVKEKTDYTGMPVRDGVSAIRGTAYPGFTPDGPLKILVIGGSQGARVFSQIIPEALGKLPPALQRRVEISQQCRPEDLESAQEAYKDTTVKAELKTFFDDIPKRLAESHLVIARSGASTIAELTTVGRPAILVPYPYAADDHQTYNAHAIDEAGGGWLMPQDSFTADNLAERLHALFSLPQTLQNAAAGALAAGRPDAAEKLADMVFALLPSNGNGNSANGRAAA